MLKLIRAKKIDSLSKNNRVNIYKSDQHQYNKMVLKHTFVDTPTLTHIYTENVKNKKCDATEIKSNYAT